MGEIDRTGRVPQCGDKDARKHLIGAANVLLTRIRRPTARQARSLAFAERSGVKKAKVAVTRKLAGHPPSHVAGRNRVPLERRAAKAT
ncbi:hypothetical protein [Roseicella aerolata]|uniref:Transposase n=1 Tax=Roseicella aerolata TaxID=2883479 RepID=A0A9X1LAB0_9PROT|nr:hypothetical protein [Roseicella aerolata]MCB4824816.1 hypothetical protein [Roseicella aerolata]